jgi:ornithine cyclodeaminase/alanine dehydrogenase-like protein (mu-crystallin family)
MKLTLLSANDLRVALPMPAAIAAMKAAFAELSAGQAQVPLRTAVRVPPADGVTLIMPAWLPGSGLGAKIVSVFPRNVEFGRAMINGLVVVLDAQTGEPQALCDGTFLTAWRTAAGAGAGIDLLALPEAAVGALFGCGAVGRCTLIAMDAARRLREIRVYARTSASVERFVAEMQPNVSAQLAPAASPDEAVRGAQVICTATTSATPVFDGRLLSAGAHISGLGSYTTSMQEVDAETVGRARIFVDSRESALAEAGDLVIPMQAGQTLSHEWTELGEVAAGTKPGRQSADEVTFFKSVGVAVQDVSAAACAMAEARRLGLGIEVEF